MSACTARRPDYHHDFAMHRADRNEPILAIVKPIIPARKVPSDEKATRIGEIEAPSGKGGITFGRIESDLHVDYRSYGNRVRQEFL
jgi:hypothetical protein